MDSYIETFFNTLTWYRNISKGLIDELPEESMHSSISERSLTPACQLVDLGDFHIRVCKLIDPTIAELSRPDPETATKQEMKDYIEACEKVLKETLLAIPDKEHFKITWFDRMTFNLPDVLSFILAHEAMHHGELMSFVYDKDLPMPKAFTETWGMC